MEGVKKHSWLTLHSARTQKYELDDISVIIPSAHGRYENRWRWFWEQYVAKTHPLVVENTYVPCDPEEVDFLHSIGIKTTVVTAPRWIVPKTLHALDYITTRLTFRLANDIMVVREGWEDILLKQFNAEEKLQLISETQTGISFPETQHKLQKDWNWLKKEYQEDCTAAQYPHGSRLFAQTGVWNGYYRDVLRYTQHEHDDIIFGQLARADGIAFTKFGGINLYLAHVGITNKDFTDEYVKEHIGGRRAELASAPDRHAFSIVL